MPWSVTSPDTSYAMDFRYYQVLLMPWIGVLLVLQMRWIVVLPDTTYAMDYGITWYY